MESKFPEKRKCGYVIEDNIKRVVGFFFVELEEPLHFKWRSPSYTAKLTISNIGVLHDRLATVLSRESGQGSGS